MDDKGLKPASAHDLPAPPSIWAPSVFGATAVFTALAIGSGELMFWPGLVLTAGSGVLWTAIIAVVIQWFFNTEIARYSLATGESVVVGATRAAPWLGVLLLAGAIVPWLWPGWIRSAGQMAAGMAGLPEQHVSTAALLSCVLILALPQRIYPAVERMQAIMLGVILAGVTVLFALVLGREGGLDLFVLDFLALQGGGAAISDIVTRSDAAYFGLLGGIVFAGAGGILNIGYGLLLCEKGFGMGHRSERISGLLRTRGLASDGPATMAPTPENRARWSKWMKLVRIEHAVLFVGGNVASIIFISAIFFMLFQTAPTEASGINLLVDVYNRFAAAYGQGTAYLFGVVGFLVFYTSALGILDFTARIASGIARTLAPKWKISGAGWFHFFMLSEAAIAMVLIYADPRQPFWLLTTSAVLNTAVMAVYALTVIWLNRTKLPAFVRTPWPLALCVVAGGVVYGAVFALTLTKLVG